jgi:hypothetical protein
MPKGSVEFRSLTELKRKIDHLEITPARAASIMRLERTLVWRAYNGRPITQANAAMIAARLHLLAGSDKQDVVYATQLLHYLLRAVEEYEAERSGGKRDRRSRQS